MEQLARKRCVPCDGDTERLSAARVTELLAEVPGWRAVEEGKKLERRYSFRDFKAAIAFVNRMAEVAEAEQHHPDFFLHSYKRLDVWLSTHAIGGLSENDFILAAKLDELGPG
jgi:4a-hydroxytetrahydrobiopterin dehydratase